MKNTIQSKRIFAAAGSVMALVGSVIPGVTAAPAGNSITSGPDRHLFQPQDELTGQLLTSPPNKRITPGYRKWLASNNVSGAGVRVAVIDTGVSPLHPDLDGDKVAARFDYTPYTGEPVDSYGHGTSVASVIAGEPDPPTGFSDPWGFLYGLGIAPEARLVSQNFNATSARVRGFPPYSKLAEDSISANAYIWNASWGSTGATWAGYGKGEAEFDQLALDAMASKRGRQQLLVVFSAGNDGTATISDPHEAKNVITVGATGSGRGYIDNPSLITGDPEAVSAFSSRGPTQDGRIFPTLAAPGDNVAVARGPDSALPCAPIIRTASLYCTGSGTSLAAPHVSGAAALVHEWWQKRYKRRPSPAMVKALLINAAKDIGKPDIPNKDEGWGRLDLKGLFAHQDSRLVDQKDMLHKRGERSAYVVNHRAGDGPLKVTLTWSDAPGIPGSPSGALRNDLDLLLQKLNPAGRVTKSWRGNNFAAGWSRPGGTRDRLNNVECIYLKAPTTNRYRVVVTAASLKGDVSPGGGPTRQDYALVVARSRR